MSQCSDSLHLNGVSLIQRVVENTWRVDDLPPCVLVVCVAHKQVLCREGVRLHVDISIGDIVDEAGLANIWEASDDESPRVRVNRWQPAQMLSDLFKVAERRLEFLNQGASSTESCAFQLLGAIKRICVLEEAHVVVCDAVRDRLGLVAVAQRQLVMVTIIQHVHQVRVERVNIVQLGEAIDNSSQFLIDRLLHELDFAHVKFANSLYLEALADLSRSLALCLGKHNIDQIVGFWDLDDLLEVICTRGHLSIFSYILKELFLLITSKFISK